MYSVALPILLSIVELYYKSPRMVFYDSIARESWFEIFRAFIMLPIEGDHWTHRSRPI